MERLEYKKVIGFTKVQQNAFKTLENYGVPVTVRDTRGREIDGACGQLAAAEIATK